MQTIVGFVQRNPWFVTLFIAAVVFWVASLALIFRSSKFRRKWLWVLLALLSFTWGWSPDDIPDWQFSIPVGSFFIFWHWMSGKPPPTEETTKALL
jgi:hypothetical protein